MVAENLGIDFAPWARSRVNRATVPARRRLGDMKYAVACIGLSLFVANCSDSSSSEDDNGRFRHLIVAPQFKYGSTCDKHQTSNIDGDISTTVTHLCLDGQDCNTISDNSYETAIGNSALGLQTVYDSVTLFEGTCDKPTAITCTNRKPSDACVQCLYSICCDRAALCEDDPNCVAITVCVASCGSDSSCADTCVADGDPVASTNFLAKLQCASGPCANSCARSGDGGADGQ